jgi:hypothetical protein
MTDADLALRLRRLEDREEIRTLIARYGQTVDDREIEELGELFTTDGVMRSQDGVMNARSRAAIVEQFHGRFAVLGPSLHYTHDHIVTLDDKDPDLAHGMILSHAEVWRNGAALIAAIRYFDTYRREGGRWRFAERLLKFLTTSRCPSTRRRSATAIACGRMAIAGPPTGLKARRPGSVTTGADCRRADRHHRVTNP